MILCDGKQNVNKVAFSVCMHVMLKANGKKWAADSLFLNCQYKHMFESTWGAFRQFIEMLKSSFFIWAKHKYLNLSTRVWMNREKRYLFRLNFIHYINRAFVMCSILKNMNKNGIYDAVVNSGYFTIQHIVFLNV